MQERCVIYQSVRVSLLFITNYSNSFTQSQIQLALFTEINPNLSCFEKIYFLFVIRV